METFELTPFDSLVSDNHLQMLKAAIPYIPSSQQRILSLYVKFLEFSNTYQLVHTADSQMLGICSIEEPKRTPADMLNAVKQYCGESEKEMIDLISNFMSAFQISHTYQETQKKSNEPERKENMSTMDMIKNLLPPEQKVMLDTYSSLLAGAK